MNDKVCTSKLGAVNFEMTVRSLSGDGEWPIRCNSLEGRGEVYWDSVESH